MSAPLLPKLQTYWFVCQSVEAIKEHDRTGRLDGTQINTKINFARTNKKKVVAELILRTKDEVSINPPYKFRLHVVSHFEDPDPTAELPPEFSLTIASLLVGVVRERLAELTGRSPFGPFMLQPIPLGIEPFAPMPPRRPDSEPSDTEPQPAVH